MSLLWCQLDNLSGRQGVPETWRRLMGKEYEPFKREFLSKTGYEATRYPSPHICDCGLRVVTHSDKTKVGVSECGSVGCKDIKLTKAEVELWALDIKKLGRAIAWAFDCSPREPEDFVRLAMQVAAYGPAATTVFLTLSVNRDEFQQVVAGLVAEVSQPFILFGLTNRFLDQRAKELLARHGSQFFDLVSHTEFTEAGKLTAKTPAGVLFAEFLPAAARTPLARASAPRYLFAKSGSVWRVRFDGGEEFHVSDTLGARYLDYLLRRPNEPISAFDLEVAITPDKGKARGKDSIQQGIDGESVRAYLRELNALRVKKEQALDDGDDGEVGRLNDEIEAISKQLKKRGQSVDTGERARGNVSKAVIAVRKKLLKGNKHEKAFGEHIFQHVNLGYECQYRQPQGKLWD